MVESGSMQGHPPMPSPREGFEHIHRYWDGSFNKYIAKVKPGEFYVTTNDEAIMTVLGSCISACICDLSNGVGGINHFMLPLKGSTYEKNADMDSGEAARYGNWAMEFLINEILKAGGKRRNLEVKVFGGGNIIGSSGVVGRNNVSFVQEYIFDENLNLTASDLGEDYARQLIYFPQLGKVKMRKLKTPQASLLQQEKSYMDSITQEKPADDDIELF